MERHHEISYNPSFVHQTFAQVLGLLRDLAWQQKLRKRDWAVQNWISHSQPERSADIFAFLFFLFLQEGKSETGKSLWSLKHAEKIYNFASADILQRQQWIAGEQIHGVESWLSLNLGLSLRGEL